jgi:hypothetical protein
MKRQERETVRRCAIYTRVSTEYGLEQEFNSLDNQRGRCHVRGFYLSTAWSGQKSDRGKSMSQRTRCHRPSPQKSPILGECDNAIYDHAQLDLATPLGLSSWNLL